MGASVRVATHEDIDWIVDELKRFAALARTKKPLFGSEAHAVPFISSCIDHHVALIAESETHERLGVIIGTLCPHPFNPEIRLLSEIFFWVTEAARGSRAAPLLLNAFDLIGSQRADWITLSKFFTSPIHSRSYERRGYRLQEQTFLKETG